MKRRREDPRYPSDMTHYTRRALILVFVVALGVLIGVVLVMR